MKHNYIPRRRGRIVRLVDCKFSGNHLIYTVEYEGGIFVTDRMTLYVVNGDERLGR